MTDDIDIAQLPIPAQDRARCTECGSGPSGMGDCCADYRPTVSDGAYIERLTKALEQARKERDAARWADETRLKSSLALIAERDRLRALYDELLKSRSEGTRLAFARADAAETERDALRQQLEAVTRERDEARAEVSRLRDYREGKRKDDGYSEGDYEAVASNIADDPRWANRSDSQLVARWALKMRKERDEAVQRTEAGIAAWLDDAARQAHRAADSWDSHEVIMRANNKSETIADVARDIRAGAWRAKEGK